MDATELAETPAFGPWLAALHEEGGVRVAEPPAAAILQLQLTAAGRGALRDRCAERLGLVLPEGPRLAEGGGLAALGVGPETWLLLAAGRPAGEVAALLDGCGAVADQSGAYARLRLSGPRTADVLAKGAFVDFHESAFPPGQVAATLLAHMNVVLWRLPGPMAFEVLVFRSYAESFWRWLARAAGEFGLGRA